MTRVLIRWCTLAGVVAGVLGLTAQASGATGWTVVTPPALPPGTQNFLSGSFALSDTNTWAVGTTVNDSTGAQAPLVLHRNGTAWSTVATPTPSGSTPNWAFKSVAASSASDAWAVGVQSAGTKIHNSLIEHWNGTAWSVVSGALPALAVSADGPTDIWGIYRNDQVIHYNGTSWSATTLSAPGGTPVFQSVEALSPTDVWVAGSVGNGPVLEHFNGTSWQVVKLPSSFSAFGLNAITARSDSDLWVFSNTGSPGVPLLLAHFNGTSWTTSPSPLPPNTLVSIGSAASSPSHVWLFGTNYNAGNEPLILSHS